MIIILTSERELKNEGQQLNQLFDEGLQILHLRKPTFDVEGYRNLLQIIDSKHYSKIMIHQYHELCNEFGLRGVHIQEQPRLDLGIGLQAYVADFKEKGYYVSSSFHSKEAISSCEVTFDYVFLSPVFGSISKKGYEGKGFDVHDLNAIVIGMGGVHEETLQATYDLGYKGVGILGGIWNRDHAVQAFISIQQKKQDLMLNP